jgi:putative transposase
LGVGESLPWAALTSAASVSLHVGLVTRKVRRYSGGVHDLGLHVVWCPKYRRQVLGGRVAVRLRELIEQKATEKGWEIITLEVTPDHIHVFVKHRPKSSASYVANQFKGFTSRVLREEFPHLKSRMPTLWSSSFFVASVGAVSADTVEKYISTQWERPRIKGHKAKEAKRAPRV